MLFWILWMKLLQSTNHFIRTCRSVYIVKYFYLPVLANSGITELFLKAINCEVGVTFVLEEALAFMPQSNRVRIKCSGLRWKELKRYFLWFYGSNINLRVFRILKEGILSILIDWSVEDKKLNKSKLYSSWKYFYLPLHALNISNPASNSLGIVYNLLNNIKLKQI